MTPSWRLQRVAGDPAALHGVDRAGPERAVIVYQAAHPAIVLGSTQPDADVVERDGTPVVRRRSGGGAVWVAPEDPVWVDVVVPAGDPWWRDDVGQAAEQIGERWRLALAALGIVGTLHRGAFEPRAWGRKVCFAGLGPGEVVGDRGAKLVGIAQRRSRAAAVFQCAAYRRWAPEPLARALGIDPAELADAGLGTGCEQRDVVDALMEALHD